jgi:transglutaminase-like putative cysteine protease
MRLEIVHDTTYNFTAPVFLEPHTICLRPHTNARQQLISYDMIVEPEPIGLSECTELTGTATTMWFEGLWTRLSIRVRSQVELPQHNPYNFFVTHPGTLTLPANYPASARPDLHAYRKRGRKSQDVTVFADDAAKAAQRDTLRFLSDLPNTIYNGFNRDVREHGRVWPPSKTLRERRGACRDLAVLFIDACRSQGLAARFVSGYVFGEAQSERHLHAWAEVYLPGAGWRGYDPSNGLAVAGDHVSVAYAADPLTAAPVTGTYRGTDVKSTIAYRIRMKALPDQSRLSD